MKNIREAIRDVIEQRILPQIERDGISNLLLSEQITPADCVEESRCDRKCNPGHRERNLVIGLTGRTPFCIEKRAFVFTPGRIVLMPIGTIHTAVQTNWSRAMKFDPDWSHSILFLTVYPFGIRVQVFHIMSEADTVETTQPYMLLGRHFSRLTNDLLEETRSRPPEYDRVGRYILLEFLSRCLRATVVDPAVDILSIPPGRKAHPRNLSESGSQRTPAGRKRKGRPAKTDSKELPTSLRAAQDFIHANYDTPISLDDIADAAHISVAYFCRQFKAALGVTPIRYLQNIRMEAARELVLTDMRVSEVARMVGIEDPYYFSRVFRRTNGLSPLQYRRKMAKVSNPS